MASTMLSILLSHLILFSIFSSFTAATTRKDRNFVQTLNPRILGLGKQKLTQFRFYWHDITTGKNPTAIRMVLPHNSTDPTGFGTITMIDDPMTKGPELSSKMVGRAQGFYALSSQGEYKSLSLLMSMNFTFTEGKYNGSTITILGRDPVFAKVREMPVVGGSGLFRFATGYVEARTHTWDQSITGDAIVEYTCYVLHY